MVTIPPYTVQQFSIVECIRSYLQHILLSESSVAPDSTDRFYQRFHKI